MTEWVRLYHDTPTDPKWRVIARKSGQRISDVLAVWMFVLTNASANACERGRTLNIVHEDIAAALDLESEQVAQILNAMEGKVISDGKLTGWEKRNPIKEDGSAERSKRWRERQRTLANATERPDTESDTDKISSLRSDNGACDAPPKPKRKNAQSLPEDFPGQTDRETAVEYWNSKGREDLSARIDDEIEQFRDYHVAHGTTSKSWSASWRTWTKNALKFNRKQNDGGQSPHDKFLAAGLEAIEARDRARRASG